MPAPTITSLPTAAAYINRIRDLIPDAVYSADGTASPQSDGDLFRAQTIIRWLNDGVYETAQRIGWQTEDWFAFQMATYQDAYLIDPRWVDVKEAFANQWQLTFLNQGYTIYPTMPVQKPLWWGKAYRGNQYAINFYPVPNLTDPTTTLVATIQSDTTTQMSVTADTGFYTYGYIQIDTEIIRYGTLNSNAPATLQRGVCGTTAAQHVTGASVYHLGLWIKGPRLPSAITTTTSVIELPMAYQYPVDLYVLAMAARAQNDEQQSMSIMREYDQTMQRIISDPRWRKNQGNRVLGYGEAPLGGLAWGRVILPALAFLMVLYA